MEESSEKKEYIFDTSALISLGAIKLVDEVLALARITLTASIIKELEEFAKYDDEYGKASKEVLKYKDKLIVKETEIKESIDYIQIADNELYNLAKRQSSALITDDIKFSRHVDGKIETQFSTFFLTLLVSSKYLSKDKALDKLEELRNIRNWKNNIIYLITKNQLEQL